MNDITNHKIINAILEINSEAEVSVSGGDIDSIVWENGTTPINKTDIQNKMTELQNSYDAQEYARNRKAEYPDIGDQLDDLFHAGAFSTEMTATIQAVKDKFPKE